MWMIKAILIPLAVMLAAMVSLLIFVIVPILIPEARPFYRKGLRFLKGEFSRMTKVPR